MDFNVIWSDEAMADLREICSYIARDNPEAALKRI
jgi:plasmid stabilization system protein ParE